MEPKTPAGAAEGPRRPANQPTTTYRGWVSESAAAPRHDSSSSDPAGSHLAHLAHRCSPPGANPSPEAGPWVGGGPPG
ncbi:hypothetical protein CKAH01_12394 [Colletotrichum kahawae]|uniref:Uncharacterized protein n=1 Tax=Colletotrichum kahawae TaxID=34407 RepID=A0AAE0DCR3_COLKA|nr:hypothetical protein CKAH01_12394 [Colletotrichum kahawae]